MSEIKKIFTGTSWFFPFAGLLSLGLGTVIAAESGKPISFVSLLAGIFIFLSLFLLERIQNYISSSKTNLFSKVGRTDKLRNPQLVALIFGAFALIFVCLYLLLREQVLIGVNLIWLGLLVLLFTISFSQAGRLWSLGFRWLLEGLIISPVLLLLGSSLQGSQPVYAQLLLALAVFLLYGGISIALLFPNYEDTLEKGSRSFLTVIGWEQAITVHNVLLLMAIICLGGYSFVSGSWRTHWGSFAMVLVAGLEIYLLQRLSRGMKPNWPLLQAVGISLFTSVMYFLYFGFINY